MNINFSDKIRILKKRLTNESERTRIQFLCVYVVFSLVSFIMTAVNAVTGFDFLKNLTLVFGIMNVVNALLSIKPTKLEHIARILFAAESLWLFTSFIVSGEPEGFSVLWIALMPTLGMLLYRKKYGTLISAAVFLEVVFFFWTPIGKGLLQYDYTSSFMLRFPILFLAFFAAGYIFELIRGFTQEELNFSRNKYIKLSFTDLLTGLGNESSYIRKIDKIEKSIASGDASFAVVFLDVNNVKATNDAYGHRFGCFLIVTAGKLLPSIFGTSDIFHIGGDEFVIIVSGKDLDHLESRIEKLKDELSYKIIRYEKTDLILSVAYGYSVYRSGDKYTSVLQRADKNMYKTKKKMKEQYNISMR